MKLIVTTHGETLENLEGILQGQRPRTLSLLGLEQAQNVSTYLKNRRIDYICTSKMNRCVKTGKIISGTHPEAIFKQDLRLNARNLGVFEGMKKCDAPWDSLDGDFFTNRPKGGETLYETWSRIQSFYDEIRNLPKESTLLVIAHGESTVLLGGMVNGYDLSTAFDRVVESEKAEISEYELNVNDRNRILLSNYNKHLVKIN